MKKIGPLFLIVIVGVAMAVPYLPWWALLLGLVALVVIGKFVIKRLVLRLFLKPFQLKGAVLKEATADIHSVTPAEPPPGEYAELTKTTSQTYYSLDVTIRPGSATTPFACWEPGELLMVSPDSVLIPNNCESTESDGLCEIQAVEVEQDGRFQPHDGLKFQGPQRLKLTIAVKPGTPALKFRYCFEDFGCVALLAPPITRAA